MSISGNPWVNSGDPISKDSLRKPDKDFMDGVDKMSYEDMLRHWRHSHIGSSDFQGGNGHYFSKEMAKKKAELPAGEAVAISKRVGWDG